MRITQFKPTLYVLLILGITGFAIASRSPGIWLLGVCGVAINGWLVYSGRFRPLPRLLANVITIGSMLFVARQLFSPAASPVLTIGQFLVILQIVKLWEQRANRDYGQLLVLSLLLMVAASINTSSLAFGILLLVYLFLSLYCCLLFHLKVETDKAMAAFPLPEEKVSPALLRQDERYLSRSMRRLASVTASGSLFAGIIVFIAFPRGSSQSFLGPIQSRGSQAQVGFGGEVNFDQIARIQQNDRIVAYTSVSKNGRALAGGDTLYLRGIAMDRYRGAAVDPLGSLSRRPPGRGGFERDARDFPPVGIGRYSNIDVRRGPPAELDAGQTANVYTQRTSLSPTGTRVVFVVSGTGAPGDRIATAESFTPYRDLSLMIGTDHALQTEDPLGSVLDYSVTANDTPSRRDFFPRETPFRIGNDEALFERVEVQRQDGQELALRVNARVSSPTYLRCFGFREADFIIAVDGRPVASIPLEQQAEAVRTAYLGGKPITVLRNNQRITLPYVHPEIDSYARQPEVSGQDDAGRSLAEQRDRLAVSTPLDYEIASNIARHLRTKFSYTLDITDSETRRDRDPILWFLSEDGRRGHCEYFAGAMTLLCQSLGINARLAVGFKCDEYNPYSEQFVVRQAHAHAWVEVLTPSGWVTFDPTSSHDIDTEPQEYGLLQQFKHMMNWLEFSYANNVIAYDNDSREGLIQALEAQMTKPLYRGINEGWLTRRITDSRLYKMVTDPNSALIRWTVAVVALTAGFFAVRWAFRRWKLRRRAARMGLDSLPQQEQLRLARQLGFYDDLLRILERRDIRRPPHLTPLEFARSLLFLPGSAYRNVRQMTEVFYRVRYGQQELSAGLQRRLRRVIERIDVELEPIQTA